MSNGLGRKKKCWIIAATLTLMFAAYPASSGPASYMVGRRWLSRSAYHAVFAPLDTATRLDVPAKPPAPSGARELDTAKWPGSRYVSLYRDYTHWWYNLGWEHAGRPRPWVWSRSGPLTASRLARRGVVVDRPPEGELADGKSAENTGSKVPLGLESGRDECQHKL